MKPIFVFLSLLLSTSAVILQQDYDDVKDFKCYTISGGNNENGLTCVLPLFQKAETSFICKGKNVKINSQSTRKELVEAGITKEDGSQATVKFFGNCSQLAASNGITSMPCYFPVEVAATYPDAIADCKKNGGFLYIPDNDEAFESLLRNLPASVKSIWIGGGDLFYRNCEREFAEADGAVELANVFTKQINGKVLGYTSARQATEKFSYVCVNKCSLPTPPPKLSAPVLLNPLVDNCAQLQVTKISGGFCPGHIETTCMPNGPLQYGEKITIYATQPAKFERQYRWSINLFTSDYRIGYHFSVGEETITTGYYNGTWPTVWPKSCLGSLTPFPYKCNEIFKQEIFNTNDGLKFVTNGKETFTLPHKLGNPLKDYFFLGVHHAPNDPFLKNITVTQGGKDYPIPFSTDIRIWAYNK